MTLQENGKSNLLSSLFLKILACLLMSLDHIALLFVNPASQWTLYYVLRAIGKISFPIFAYLAYRGAFQTRNSLHYLLRLLLPALLLDAFGYLCGFLADIPIAGNPLIGNAFMDMFLGVLLVTLLKRKDRFSFFAILPLLYAFFSTFPINDSYGTLFKTDWGFFSIVLFLSFFLFDMAGRFLLRQKARNDGIEEDLYLEQSGFFYSKLCCAVALFFVEALFYLIYRLDNFAFVLPNQFVPIGTYSTLAIPFLLLSSPKKGYSSKKIQYAFYLYYPLHLAILGLIAIGLGYL